MKICSILYIFEYIIYQGGGGGDEPAPQPEEGEEGLERLERDHPCWKWSWRQIAEFATNRLLR